MARVIHPDSRRKMPGTWREQAGPFRQLTDAEGHIEFDAKGTVSLDCRLDGWYVLEYRAPVGDNFTTTVEGAAAYERLHGRP